MKSKSALLLLALVLSVVATVITCTTIFLFLENGSLRDRLAETQRLRADALTEVAQLRNQQTSAEADLSRLQADVNSLRLQAATNEIALAERTRPMPVRVYDGTRYLGVGWLRTSPTNRVSPGMAEDALAMVVLDRSSPARVNSVPTSAGGPSAASVASFAYSYQQNPYGWPVAWVVDWGSGTNSQSGAGSPPPTAAPAPDSGNPPTAPRMVMAVRKTAGQIPWPRPVLVPRTVTFSAVPRGMLPPAPAAVATPQSRLNPWIRTTSPNGTGPRRTYSSWNTSTPISFSPLNRQ